MIPVRHGPDRIGLLGKPPPAAFVPLQEPVAILALLRSPHLHAAMKQYEGGRTQPLFRGGHDHGKTSGRKPKGLRQILIIIMKHIIHNHYCNNQP
jgi:hypothetical protein